MIASIHTLEVLVPSFTAAGSPEAEKTKVVILTPEDLTALIRSILTHGRCAMTDSGDAENGPDYSYDGHGWGPLVAFADARYMVHGWHRVYTDGANLPLVMQALLAAPLF